MAKSKFLVVCGLTVLMCSCTVSRDDKLRSNNEWHMGKALVEGCNRPDLIGKMLMKIAEKHAEKNGYEIDKEPKSGK